MREDQWKEAPVHLFLVEEKVEEKVAERAMEKAMQKIMEKDILIQGNVPYHSFSYGNTYLMP